MYWHGGYPIKVADTVGAGDSFLASLIAQLLSDKSPEVALDFASVVGALVASYSDANPKFKNEEIEEFLKERV